MIRSRTPTAPIPGMAWKSASTTRRRRGTVETIRMTRRTRKARSTANSLLAGTSAIAITTKSKTPQGLRKKLHPRAAILSTSSTMKIPRMAVSSPFSRGPATAIADGDVSRPRMIAFRKISARMPLRKRPLSISRSSRPRRLKGVDGSGWRESGMATGLRSRVYIGSGNCSGNRAPAALRARFGRGGVPPRRTATRGAGAPRPGPDGSGRVFGSFMDGTWRGRPGGRVLNGSSSRPRPAGRCR